MRPHHLIPILAAALLAGAASAKPPRDESPAPRELVGAPGLADPEADLAAAVAAASAHPLGTPANPVRVGGPLGERAYLARLRCADGTLPKVGRRSEGGAGAFGSVVGLYPLDCGTAAPGRATLAFDIYHEEHHEDRAPAGFRIEAR